MRVGRDVLLPTIKPYIPGQMGDDVDGLGGAQGGGSGKDKGMATGGAGGMDEDDFDEKNMFALLMN